MRKKFTREQLTDLRTRLVLVEHYRTMHEAMEQDFYRTVSQMTGIDLDSGDYDLDLEKGVLTNADAKTK